MAVVLEALAFAGDRDEAKTILAKAASGAKGGAPASVGTAAPAATGKNACAGYAIDGSVKPTSAMSSERFTKLSAAIKSESFSEGKVRALLYFLGVTPEGLSTAQVRELIGMFAFSADKLKALEAMEARILGVSAAELTKVINEYPFSSDRLQVLTELKDSILDLDHRYDVVSALTFAADKDKVRALLEGAHGRTYLWGTVRGVRGVFVVDVSGSRSTTGALPDARTGTRLDFMKAELVRALKDLPATTHFGVLAFESRVRAFKSGLVPASNDNVDAAIAFVGGLVASGGTNVYDALNQAFAADGPDAVYLLTDGVPTEGAVTDRALARLPSQSEPSPNLTPIERATVAIATHEPHRLPA